MNPISGICTGARPRHAGRRRCGAAAVAAIAIACARPVLAGTAIAGAFHGSIGPAEPGQGINLHIERSDLDVTYADGGRGDRLEVGRIGIAFLESLDPGIRLGLSFGRQGVDQDERNTAAGLAPAGYYLAFDAAGQWRVAERFALELGGRLGYSEASDRDDDAGVELEWWSASLRPAASVLLADRFELRAGVRLQWLDGDERTTGATSASESFGEDGIVGGFASLALYTGDGGRVQLEAEGGPVRAVRLVFERQY